MHSVSDLWRTLLASPGHRKEVKLMIAGVTYGEDKIVDGSLRIDGGLYSDFGIGNCCARQIDFEIYPQGRSRGRRKSRSTCGCGSASR